MEDITQELRESAALKVHVAETQGHIIQAMLECMWESLRQGGKILLCGNGGSAADAQHLATECMVRQEAERAPLPAIALTTDTSLLTAAGNDHGFETIFARQVAGLGRPGDVLLAISTSGNSPNVVRAVEEAHRRGLHTLGLLGKDGGRLKEMVLYCSRGAIVQHTAHPGGPHHPGAHPVRCPGGPCAQHSSGSVLA